MPPVLILLTLLLMLGASGEEIIGGHEVKPHSRPYMTFIKYVDSNGNRKYCGGFLVRDNFVLTAAHCLGSSMTVILGAHNIKAQEDTQQIIPVAKAISHPDYNPNDHSNDIMLLKLQRKAIRTKAVSPLKLPRANAQLKPGYVCHLAGWGRKSLHATKGTDLLQEAEFTIQDDQKCKRLFHNYIKTKEICAGDPKEIQAVFKGDSGGPLVCDNRAYGVLSYGEDETIAPGIFIKVVSFLPWIRRSMKPSNRC
ncbi:granzyme G-like [Peromyscus californicus insignis]|uniref:granzyme G-like n=1 Tax=Peromyscus californicus insignis TaxID=564181 RepID=UPI0022A7BB28|nr:granzyme G-like [Peromyscus californicus insignis]XP_052587972.1 granzyme G-like [Peromyscus californicus insignis]